MTFGIVKLLNISIVEISMKELLEINLSVIGLGYVGLPLAVEFGKKRTVVGFDINQPRIAALQAGHDSTLRSE